jgi:hypothetical protein
MFDRKTTIERSASSLPIVDQLESRRLLNSAYANIAGTWSGTETVRYTIRAMGQSESSSQSGSGSVLIQQKGSQIWYERKWSGMGSSGTVTRKGTIRGNHVTFTGPFVVLAPGFKVTKNTCTIQGDLVGNTIRLTGSGSAAGSYQGVSGTVDGTSTAVFTRPATPADAYEADGSASSAKPIVSGQAQSRTIHTVGDTDWATFTLTQPSNVSLGTGGSGDMEMWLYGPNSAKTLADHNDDGKGTNALVSRTGNKALLPGTYYVKVQAWGNKNIVPSYTLSLKATASFGAKVKTVAFGGSGQITLWKQGATPWQQDDYAATGVTAIPKGVAAPVWKDLNLDGDAADAGEVYEPVAFVSGGSATLKTVFAATGSIAGSLKFSATGSIGGQAVTFNGAGTLLKGSITVSLTSATSLSSTIFSGEVPLAWRISYDAGKTYFPLQTTTHQLFVTAADPVKAGGLAAQDVTAKRVAYAAGLANGKSGILDIADAVASDAQGHFNALEHHIGADAWNVLVNGGDCASGSFLQKNALNELGLGAEVRYVFARHASWDGLWSTADSALETNPDNTDKKLVFVKGDALNNYEAACFVTDGTSRRYYLGGFGGQSATSAYGVWQAMIDDGWHQEWWESNPGDGIAIDGPQTLPPAD